MDIVLKSAYEFRRISKNIMDSIEGSLQTITFIKNDYTWYDWVKINDTLKVYCFFKKKFDEANFFINTKQADT